MARYIVADETTGSEFVIVAADYQQCRGTGALLIQALMETARAHGFRMMFGAVLSGNHRMLEFTNRIGVQLRMQTGNSGMMG